MKQRKYVLSELRPAVSPQRTALLLALFVFLIIFTISSVFARSMQEQNNRDFDAKIKQQATNLQTHLVTSTENYHRLLYAASAMFLVKSDPTRDEWRTYYESAKVGTMYPELIGLGYAPVVTRENREDFEALVQATGIDAYTVTPQSERELLTPVMYLEPQSDVNKVAYGFDMSSEVTRRTAIERARDTAEATMTAPVHLIQDGTSAQTGVLIYFPIYQSSVTPTTIQARREQIKGYIYVVLHPSNLVKQNLDAHRDEYLQTAVQVTDVTNQQSKDAVFSMVAVQTANGGETVIAHEESTMSGRTWSVRAEGQRTIVQQLSPFVVFGLGTIVSLLATWAVYQSVIRRLKHIATTYEGEVQRTKDELLALASHQLRTPASGVKQYIGILTSGLFGKLTPDQLSIAKKAYEANERQLEIINELLYVSKADAGQLVVEPKSFDMTKLVERSADNLVEQAAHKNITLLFPTKKSYLLTADDRYIAMAIDNLISNAIKYSYPSSIIRMNVSSTRDKVKFVIRDHGVGIADVDKERVFGKFNRIDNPLSHAEGGSGLGLFLARELARAHGGDITVDSVLEKGSTFTLVLPKRLTIDQAIVNLDGEKLDQER